MQPDDDLSLVEPCECRGCGEEWDACTCDSGCGVVLFAVSVFAIIGMVGWFLGRL